LGVEADLQPVMGRVILEVPDPFISGGELPIATDRRAIPGHRRHPAGRVEPQRRITRSPARPNSVGALQDHGIETGAAKACGGAQPGRPRSADHHISHATTLVHAYLPRGNRPAYVRAIGSPAMTPVRPQPEVG